MGIKSTKNILDKKDSIFARNTPIQNQIQRYEESGSDRDKPELDPMIINFNKLKGNWNEAVFTLFCETLEEEGYGGVNEAHPEIADEEVEKLRDAFFKRLGRMQTELNKYRPREGEHPEDTEERIAIINAKTTSANRKIGRRKHVGNRFIVYYIH